MPSFNSLKDKSLRTNRKLTQRIRGDLLLHFAIGENPCGLAKCNTGIVQKVMAGIKRGLFDSDIQTLEFSE